MNIIEIIKAIIVGIVEGITEWLPISSTGHIILTDAFLPLKVSEGFKEMFDVVIQLGAIFAVILLFWNKLWPFTRYRESTGVVTVGRVCAVKKNSMRLWLKVIIACLPSVLIGLPLDDWMDEHLYNPTVVSIMLIVYGIAFIIVEQFNKKREPRIVTGQNLSYAMAFFIGCFQALAIIPGTSRSGATILGAILLGCSRTLAAEFSFFLAVPTMFGASLLKVVKFIMEGGRFTGSEIVILAAATITAFIVSVAAIKFLLGFVKKRSFASFGYYRIALGALVLILLYSGVIQG